MQANIPGLAHALSNVMTKYLAGQAGSKKALDNSILIKLAKMYLIIKPMIIANLQISNSNQSNQNLERLYIRGVVCLVVRLVVRHV